MYSYSEERQGTLLFYKSVSEGKYFIAISVLSEEILTILNKKVFLKMIFALVEFERLHSLAKKKV